MKRKTFEKILGTSNNVLKKIRFKEKPPVELEISLFYFCVTILYSTLHYYTVIHLRRTNKLGGLDPTPHILKDLLID